MPSDLPMEHEAIIAEILETILDTRDGFEAERLGGLTNYNYLIDAGERRLVVRIPGDGTEGLVDRAVERDITYSASNAGVDSELLHFDAETGIKVMSLIPNALTMSQDLMKEDGYLQLAAKVMRKLHDECEPVGFRFDVFEMIPHYENLIRQDQKIDWKRYDDVRQTLFSLRTRMAEAPLVLCHCDPLCENFVLDVDAGRMYMIDWEYGGMNDPLWDVADVVIESGYDRAQREAFQNAYFGRPATDDEDERISINIVLIDFLWALWGLQRSYYDHTLIDYGPERYARALRNLDLLGI